MSLIPPTRLDSKPYKSKGATESHGMRRDGIGARSRASFALDRG